MSEYRVKRESNGDYTVTPVTSSGCATAFFVILILLVIVLIASRCSRPNGKEMKEQEQAQIAAEEAFQQQKEINLADQRGELDYTVEEEAVDCTGRTHHHVIEIAAQARPADYETELYHIPEGKAIHPAVSGVVFSLLTNLVGLFPGPNDGYTTQNAVMTALHDPAEGAS